MATDDVTLVFRCPGRLAIGATNLATAYPHGGTAIGLASKVALRQAPRTFVVRAEEYGGEATEEYNMGRDWSCAALLRQWDADALALMFPTTSVGVSGKRYATEPGAVAGTPLSDRAVVLTFTPLDSSRPGFVAYRALPQLAATERLNFHIADNLGFMATFRLIRNSAGVTLRHGLISDLA